MVRVDWSGLKVSDRTFCGERDGESEEHLSQWCTRFHLLDRLMNKLQGRTAGWWYILWLWMREVISELLFWV
jgi:hypothetical protein